MDVLNLPVGLMSANCYIVYGNDRRAVVVDPGGEEQKILSVIASQSMTVTAVVLTHVHFDHIMAAGAVCAAAGAPLCVGAGDVPALTDSRLNLTSMISEKENVSLRADVVLHEGDTVPVGEETLTVIETPGHTPGSICLSGDGILLSGDTLFCGTVGRTDFPGGDAAAMCRSVQKLMLLPDDVTVFPGHNAPTTIGTERHSNPFVTMR